MTLEEILRIEEHAETEFLNQLTPVVIDPLLIYRSRLTRVQATPSLGIKVVAGQPQRKHSHVFGGNPGYYAPDSYIGELRTTIRTNRSTDATAPSHTAMVGRTRAILNISRLKRAWASPVLFMIDCWEDTCDDSEEDPDNLDVSTISWFLVLQIKPEVWPTNPYP